MVGVTEAQPGQTADMAGEMVQTAQTEAALRGLRERKKARTREAIIDAALGLFERKGYEATTVEDIAAAADVSPRTFFRYFDAKLDVVMARNVDDGADLDELIAAMPPSATPLESVYQAIRGKLAAKVSVGDDAALREMRIVMSTPSLRSICVEKFHDNIDLFAALVAARMGVEEHALQPYIVAGAVSATMLAVMDRWVTEGGRTDRLIPLLDEGFALLRRGLDQS
jgi:AcrR family transcriptional regulator